MATQEEIVQQYQKILGRAPDDAGMKMFANYSPDALESLLRTSDEYKQKTMPFLQPGQGVNDRFTSGASYYAQQGWKPGGDYEGVPTNYTNPKTGEQVFFGNTDDNTTDHYTWHSKSEITPHQGFDENGNPLYINSKYQGGDQNQPVLDANGNTIVDENGMTKMHSQYTTEAEGNQKYMINPRVVQAHENPDKNGRLGGGEWVKPLSVLSLVGAPAAIGAIGAATGMGAVGSGALYGGAMGALTGSVKGGNGALIGGLMGAIGGGIGGGLGGGGEAQPIDINQAAAPSGMSFGDLAGYGNKALSVVKMANGIFNRPQSPQQVQQVQQTNQAPNPSPNYTPTSYAVDPAYSIAPQTMQPVATNPAYTNYTVAQENALNGIKDPIASLRSNNGLIYGAMA